MSNYPDEDLKERLKSAQIVSWSEEVTYSGGRIHVEYWLPPNPIKVEKPNYVPEFAPVKTLGTSKTPYFDLF